MTHVTMFQKLGRLAGALVIAAGMLISVSAVPTFALNIDIGNLPAGTTCVRVGVNFRECTTPDGTVYWCEDDGTCGKAPLRVHTVGDIRPVGGLVANPGNFSGPSSHHPIVPATGLTLAP